MVAVPAVFGGPVQGSPQSCRGSGPSRSHRSPHCKLRWSVCCSATPLHRAAPEGRGLRTTRGPSSGRPRGHSQAQILQALQPLGSATGGELLGVI
ncbi:hypothetical protein NDU88_003138 [Pleurodeles waltl]|uniref:Uncharacterized protein n=1 Tax=Pleurodeles waltl TaxID=8319 RepID=A0AAV7W2M2_PLEWA|nr:hypothetical protein NDU88_003138 [Pleurodeles waltl]